MKLHLLAGSTAIISIPLLLVSCIDKNYDLSDIDSTSRFAVNDLTLPVNIDPITLGDVITFDENSKIQSVNIGGKEFYALSEKGDFHSDPISIAGVSAIPTPLNPTHDTLDKIIDLSSSRRKSNSYTVTYNLVEVGNYFSYNALNIDDAIVSVDKVTTDPFEFSLTLEVEDQTHAITDMTFNNLKIRAPKGLTCTPNIGTYDSATGIWAISEVRTHSNTAKISLTATGIDMIMGGYGINPDRSLDFNSEFFIEEGNVSVTANGIVFPDKVDFYIYYGLGNLNITSFTGDIRYDLEGISIPPVSLSDIPDFLQGDRTNLELANPQLYLSVNNPVGGEGLDCETSFQFAALRNNLTPRIFTPEEDVVIGHNLGVTGPYNFVLTPEGDNLTTPTEFSQNLTRVKFNTLGALLAGEGLPQTIAIDLVNPRIPTQHVNGFQLPNRLQGVEGKYELLAPLALNDGSHVIYSETRDGWGGNDLDDLVITRLDVTATAINDCPVAVELTLWPIDVEGRNINGAVIKSTRVAAGATSDLKISLEGEVQGLDGIRIQAVLEGGNGTALAPSQTLKLTDIRATVSGYYESDF